MLIHPSWKVDAHIVYGFHARNVEQEENYKQRDLLRDIFSQINATVKGKV